MPDTYDSIATTLTSPAIDGQAVTPSNTSDLPHVSRAIYIGASGDIAVELVSGASVTFKSVPAGAMMPLRARKILSTGTTGSEIVALW